MTDKDKERFMPWLQNEIAVRQRAIVALGDKQPEVVKAKSAEMAACRIVMKLLYRSSDFSVSGTSLGADE